MLAVRQSHLSSELSRECFAQGHRGKHIQRHLPSEAFQLYLLKGLTNSGFSCCLKYCATLILKKQAAKQYNLYRTWLTRVPGHPCSWWGWVPDAAGTWEGPIWCPLSSSELSNHGSTNNLTARGHCHKIMAPTKESGTKVGRWGDGIPSCRCLVAVMVPSSRDCSWSRYLDQAPLGRIKSSSCFWRTCTCEPGVVTLTNEC